MDHTILRHLAKFSTAQNRVPLFLLDATIANDANLSGLHIYVPYAYWSVPGILGAKTPAKIKEWLHARQFKAALCKIKRQTRYRTLQDVFESSHVESYIDKLHVIDEFYNLDTLPNYYSLVRRYILRNERNALEWIATNCTFDKAKIFTYDSHILQELARMGNISLFKLVIDLFQLDGTGIVKNKYWLREAISSGHFHLVKWLIERFNLNHQDITQMGHCIFQIVGCNGLDLLRWLTLNIRILPVDVLHDKRIIPNMVFHEREEMFLWLHEECDLDIARVCTDRNILHRAAKWKKWKILKFLIGRFSLKRRNFPPNDLQYVLYYTAFHDQIDLLYWMANHLDLQTGDFMDSYRNVLDMCLTRNKLDVLKFMYREFGIGAIEIKEIFPSRELYHENLKYCDFETQKWLNEYIGMNEVYGAKN